jgi:vacuolar-type H+-ATPase subunit H
MAKYCKGSANVEMEYNSFLDASFHPLYESMQAKGKVYTRDLQIHNLNTFVKLSELLKNEKFRDMAPDEVNIGLTVRDGRVNVAPFDMNFDQSKITVSGSHGIDLTMDYLMDMDIAKRDLGDGINDMMKGITALAATAGIQVAESDHVNVKANITGTFNDPKVTTDLRGNLKSGTTAIKDVVQEKVIEEVEQVEEKVREEAGEKASEIIEQAEREADRLLAEARSAGENLVKEAEVQGEKLIEEAGSNPIKQIAARRTAEELKKQAEKQSENLVLEAQKKADEILKKASEEAERI